MDPVGTVDQADHVASADEGINPSFHIQPNPFLLGLI